MHAYRFILTAAIVTALFSASALQAQDLNWRFVAAPSLSFASNSIAFDSTGRMYLGGVNSVATSTDGGTTWESAVTDRSDFVQDIQVLPSGTVLAATNGGVFRSSNQGGSWNRVLMFPAYGCGTHIGSTHLIVTPDGSVYRSSDDGITWTKCSKIDQGFDLAATAEGEVYAVTGYAIYRSLDTGMTWKLIHESYASGIYIAPTGTILAYYIRIERSADRNSAWTFTPTYSRMYDMAAGHNGDLFTVPTGYGVLRSTDDGASWTLCDKELPFHGHRDIAVDPHGFVWVAGSDIWTTAPPASVEGTYTGAMVIGQPVPTPSGDQAAVDVQSPGETTVSFTLVDMLGCIRQSLPDVRLHAGTNRQRIDLSALPPGRYILRIDNGATQTFRSVVIVR